MQYLLTAEEYKDLQDKAKTDPNMPSKEKLQKFCTDLANTLVLTEGWAEGETWGCILTEDDHYCDECPAQKVCPHPNKAWSK